MFKPGSLKSHWTKVSFKHLGHTSLVSHVLMWHSDDAIPVLCYIMHLPSVNAWCNLNLYCIILVCTLKHVEPAKLTWASRIILSSARVYHIHGLNVWHLPRKWEMQRGNNNCKAAMYMPFQFRHAVCMTVAQVTCLNIYIQQSHMHSHGYYQWH